VPGGRAPLERRLLAAGQEHLLAHAESLPEDDRADFVASLDPVPWEEVAGALRAAKARAEAGTTSPPPELRPPEALTLRRQRIEPGFPARLAAAGAARLAEGRVAAVLLAGGQGTRLGHPGPKGTFVLGPEPDRSLYALLVESVVEAGREAGTPVPLVVLTSPETDAPTRAAFATHRAFGADPSRVRFVTQGTLPAFDDEGRALLASPGRLASAPDGHGGLVDALVAGGVLDALAREGVEWLATFQVDNPLARPLDPVFLGWTLERRASAAGKAVRTRSPDERVGVFGRDLEGRVHVLEYSEAPPGGVEGLVLGSIAVHLLSVSWLRALVAQEGFRLPLHLARKKVPHLGRDGRAVVPGAPNAWKLERFLFDAFPHAPRFAIHEVDRDREFAPVKNATGDDSPDTARALLAAELRRRASSET
jgi:UDP-N-acetylglucosamine/UDP-N-acetylgalactosamine diphosphorylase